MHLQRIEPLTKGKKDKNKHYLMSIDDLKVVINKQNINKENKVTAKSVIPYKQNNLDKRVNTRKINIPNHRNNVGSVEINICIVHYNTPLLTEALIKSINKYVPSSHIYIFDNSDVQPFTYRQDNLTYFDNTKGKILDFNSFLKKYENQLSAICKRSNYGSAKHTLSIDKCMDLINKPFILLDSDILLKKDISELFDTHYIYVGESGEAVSTRHTRVFPFCCFINTTLCKEKGIRYFDEKYMAGIDGRKEDDFYDTGAYFYKVCQTEEHKAIHYNEYIIHLASASWQNKANRESKFLKQYQNLWMEEEKLIVSMTTWPKRIDNIPTVLGTILNGDKKPEKIVINLSLKEFPNKEKDFSERVNKFINTNKDKIEIFWLEDNNRQWKKTIPTMLRYPNDCIVCIDDDRRYPKDFLSSLWSAHKQKPGHPITVNSGYKYKKTYLQHAGHGTLDKLEYYDGFKNILTPELYKMASSDTFFTLVANNVGHPILYVGKRLNISMYNEKNPLHKTEDTYGTKTHDLMYDFLKKNGKIPNLK